ncbi:hypothetical protein MRX96_007070 [Rhipicephalus microplus]
MAGSSASETVAEVTVRGTHQCQPRGCHRGSAGSTSLARDLRRPMPLIGQRFREPRQVQRLRRVRPLLYIDGILRTGIPTLVTTTQQERKD